MFTRILEKLPSNNRVERIWKIAQVEFQSRYYNDRLGLLWALIKPIFEVTLYYIVFTQFFPSSRSNYGLYLFGGIVLWNLFAECTNRGMTLLQSKLYLIDNIQFKHVDVFISHVGSSILGFLFNATAFFTLAIISADTVKILIGPFTVVIFSLIFLCLGVTFILATIQPFIKDLIHLWDMIILSGFWTSGILFETSMVIERAPIFACLNPFVGILWNGRACFLDEMEIINNYLWINLLTSIIVLIIGYVVFTLLGKKAIEKL